MTEETYRPRSPDFSSLPLPPNPTQPFASVSPHAHRASYDESPFFSSYQRDNSNFLPQQYVPPYQPAYNDMARRSSRLHPEDAPVPEPAAAMTVSTAAPSVPETTEFRHWARVEVKTKFPVARIKRIMQADEDVGKVAQVTPIAVCK